MRGKVRLLTLPLNSINSQRNNVNPGPRQVVTSLKGLEEIYASKPEWKVIDERKVLSIPVEEFRVIDLPEPDHSGKVDFGKRKDGKGNTIDEYLPIQKVGHLNKQIKTKYNKKKCWQV